MVESKHGDQQKGRKSKIHTDDVTREHENHTSGRDESDPQGDKAIFWYLGLRLIEVCRRDESVRKKGRRLPFALAPLLGRLREEMAPSRQLRVLRRLDFVDRRVLIIRNCGEIREAK